MDTPFSTHPAPDAAAPVTCVPVCSIVPPYLLEALRASSDADLQAIAERTLRHDETFRDDRRSELVAATRGTQHTTKSTGTASASGLKRQIDDAQHGTTLPGTPVRGEGDAAVSDVAVNEAYDGLGDTYKLYHDVYGRDSVDGKGLELVGTVHYSKDYDNAFWNGEQMVFGDGDGVIFTRFTGSVDVIGHELTHGVTQYTAGLAYQDQPGALNESVSDVFGSLVKQYTLGQTADQADWLIGAGILGPKIKGRALRDMLNPGTAYDDPQLGKDPQPADMAHYVQTSDDNGGVHTNSGIPNRAFALAATTAGGKAWEGVGQVWYDVLTGSKIQARCDFATFAQLTVDAATARFGADGPVTRAVQQAWQTVGVLSASGTAATDATTGGGAQPGGSKQQGGSKKSGGGVRVEVERSGGIAGITRRTSVSLDKLPTSDAEAWHQLLASRQLHELQHAGPGQVRDGYTYAVRCAEHGLDTSLDEQELPTDVRHLLERTLDAD